MLKSIVTIFCYEVWQNLKTVTITAIIGEGTPNESIIDLVTNKGMLSHKASRLGYTLEQFMSLTENKKFIAIYDDVKEGDTYEDDEGVTATYQGDWLKLSIDSKFQLAPAEGFKVLKEIKTPDTQGDQTP